MVSQLLGSGDGGIISLPGGSGSGNTVTNLVSSDPGGNGSDEGDGSEDTLVNPEPGSLLLFGTGLLGSAIGRSRIRRFFRIKK